MEKKELRISTPHRETTTNLKLSIIDSLPGRTARQVAALLGIPETTLAYHMKELRRLDVIRKVSYGTWEVIQAHKSRLYSPPPKVKKESKQLRISTLPRSTDPPMEKKDVRISQDTIASHAFIFTLQLPSLARWHKEGRRKYLTARGIEYQPLAYGERLVLNSWKVQLTDKSIVAYAPKGERWYARTAQEGYAAAAFEFLVIIQKLEALLGVSLKSATSRGGQYKIRCRREHHGFVRNALASQYVKEGKRLAVHDESGRWLLVDLSVTEGELETHAGGSQDRVNDVRDANKKVQDFFNGIKTTGITPQMILENDAKLQDRVADVTKLLERYAENIETHTAVMIKIKEFLEGKK